MRNVFTKLLYEAEKGRDTVLVTIVHHSGSTPRGKGSMMLVGSSGWLTGSVGGGEVENLAIAYARRCLTDKTDDVVPYNLADRGKKPIGMVCGGDVLISFQYVDAAGSPILDAAGTALDNMDSGITGDYIIETEKWGTFEIHYKPEERAILFGGGHIAMELVPILKRVGFNVTVMENREDYASPERFPEANVVLGDYDHVADYLKLDKDDYLVIMTNGHSHDYSIQEQVLRQESAYVGVVGSRRKIATVNHKLKAAGIKEEQLEKVHTPIGTDIKAVTPAEIAISIAGEMIYERALRRDRNQIGE